MKPDTRPHCAQCGCKTDGYECADCPRSPIRFYCMHCIKRTAGKFVCAACAKHYEPCRICYRPSANHDERSVCPRCLDAVYEEAGYLSTVFEQWAYRTGPEEGIDRAELAGITYATSAFRVWLLRQRAAAQGITVAQLLRSQMSEVNRQIAEEGKE